MTLLKSLITFTAAMFFAGSVIAQDTPIKEYSSDNRLMSNVVTVEVLENGMVVHAWEWNDTAKALDPKYGAAPEDGGYMPDGLIAQDVEKVLPSAISEKQLPLKIDDGVEYKVLQYDQTIGLLVEAIKELTAKVEELEKK